MVEISAIITFHREGLLAHATLRSIERCRRFAEGQGMRVEYVITLDRADEETHRVVCGHPALREGDSVSEVDFGDLGMSRNFAIDRARGDYVATLDGDDYFSANWFVRSAEVAHSEGDRCVVHPEVVVAFGAWNGYWWQIDQRGDRFDPDSLLMVNHWNACAFAKRQAFIDHPYRPSRVGECGFGYEDWHWNCETIADGYVHRLAEGTVRFERRKEDGSLNTAHDRVSAIIRPSSFFDER